MGGFFAHTSGAGVGFTCLAETTYSGVLDSIVNDIGTGTINGWSLYDDQRVSGTGNFIVAYGNMGSTDGASVAAMCDWISGSSTSSVAGNRWSSNVGNSAITEIYPSRTQISFDTKTWFTATSIPVLSGTNGFSWSFTINTPYTGTSFLANPYYVKLQHYIVLRQVSSQKTFYVLLAKPDSPCDILRVQVFESWNATTHVGTNGSNQEILRGLDQPDTTFWNNNWDNQPVRYLLWLLPDVFGIWASFGSGPTTRVVKYDFAYAGNLDTSAVRSNDTNALVFGCSNNALSGFGVALNVSPYGGYSANSNAGNTGGMRCLRTLQGEPWSHPSATQSGSYRPSGWFPNNQYAPYPRAMPYHNRIDAPFLDVNNRIQFTEFDVYNVGNNGAYGAFQNQYTGFTGSSGPEGKRGMLRYVKCPMYNPIGGLLTTYGPADDGNTYVMFKTYYCQVANGSITSPIGRYLDVGEEEKMTGWASTEKIPGSSNPLGEVVIIASPDVWWYRWLMMPINL